MQSKSRIRSRCLACGEPIFFNSFPRLGGMVTCQYCDEKLEVIRLEPLVVDWPWEHEMAYEKYYIEEDHGY